MYEIEFNESGSYTFNNLTESLCRLMCDVKDQGERYSNTSRYLYSYNNYDKNKSEFRFGTAKACIQSYLIDNKKIDKKFNIYLVTMNGKLKCRTLYK